MERSKPETNPFIAKIEAAKSAVRQERSQPIPVKGTEAQPQPQKRDAEWIQMTDDYKVMALARIPLTDKHESDLIGLYIIIPDGQLPDAHKNEIELSSFIRQYLKQR